MESVEVQIDVTVSLSSYLVVANGAVKEALTRPGILVKEMASICHYLGELALQPTRVSWLTYLHCDRPTAELT